MTLISIRIIKVALLGVFVYLTTLLTNFFLDRFNSPEWSVMLFGIIISTLILLFCLETIPDFFQRRFSKYKYYSKNELNRVDFDSFVMKSINEMNSDHEEESEVKIFRNAIDFSSLKLRDCMVPRADIVAVSIDTDVETLKERFIETGISRILVYKDDIDNITGYIHMWEMFNNQEDWTTNIATISFVPESMQASKLMSDLMLQRKSIAVVVDEFGGTSGIVTMEDLVEEIFGEIEDEYDIKSSFIKQESENEFVLSGRVEIDYLNDIYGLDIPETDGYSTVAGYLLHHTQRFPKTYETIIIENYTFKILKVTERKIEVVRMIIDNLT
jgi:CBS domain containing-hemolysin-like protein